jgi:hypothetical protein
MDCKNCGLPIGENDENCPTCGAPREAVAPVAPAAPEEAAPATHRFPFNPIMATCCGFAVFVVFVVLCWLGWTAYAFYHTAPSKPTIPVAITAPPLAPGVGSGPAYAVSDIEGGSESDRKSFDGKTINVEGYVVSLADGEAKIADSASGTGPTMKLGGSLGSAKKGDHAKFQGTYSASKRTLTVTAVHPE